MPRVQFVKSARKDIPGTDIKKGDSYFWWKFRFGGKRTSKTYPSRSQLTQSSFLQTVYDIEDRIASCSFADMDDAEEQIQGFVDELNELRDTCQESLDNMPEQLQYAPTGELLQERIDALESAISDLESITVDDGTLEVSPDEIDDDLRFFLGFFLQRVFLFLFEDHPRPFLHSLQSHRLRELEEEVQGISIGV
jgi:hypothetical protein